MRILDALLQHRYTLLLTALLLALIVFPTHAHTRVALAGSADTTIVTADTHSFEESCSSSADRPSPLLQLVKQKRRNSRKAIATTLAFPLPFGIVGLHRIYLGCAPYVPVAYIASLGGVFGALPFIDFCVLLAAKNTDPYTNNKKIFMWVN